MIREGHLGPGVPGWIDSKEFSDEGDLGVYQVMHDFCATSAHISPRYRFIHSACSQRSLFLHLYCPIEDFTCI
jgi:hypothetical protein